MEELTNAFWLEGLSFIKHHVSNSNIVGNRRFRAFYGVSPKVCAVIWNSIIDKPLGSQLKHLLWTLLFLKRYNTEHINAALVLADEKTFRLWTWRFIDVLAKLDVIKWENRKNNSKTNSTMYVSLDGTDYRIQEPTKFDKKWFSHKFSGPGIRYEIGISISNGDIVWASGGFPCGEWPDIKIARDLYIHYASNEMTLADKGYRDARYFKQPTNYKEKCVLARHETLNGRLKQFEILNSKFRHPLKKHPLVFHALVNIVQITIENGEKLFEI